MINVCEASPGAVAPSTRQPEMHRSARKCEYRVLSRTDENYLSRFSDLRNASSGRYVALAFLEVRRCRTGTRCGSHCNRRKLIHVHLQTDLSRPCPSSVFSINEPVQCCIEPDRTQYCTWQPPSSHPDPAKRPAHRPEPEGRVQARKAAAPRRLERAGFLTTFQAKNQGPAVSNDSSGPFLFRINTLRDPNAPIGSPKLSLPIGVSTYVKIHTAISVNHIIDS